MEIIKLDYNHSITLSEEIIATIGEFDGIHIAHQMLFDKTIELSCDYSIVSEFRFDGENYSEEKFVAATNSLSFGKIMPAEFKIFMVIK